MQEDFPLTPSAVYSKRLLANAEGRFDQDIGEDEDNHGEDPLLAAATSAHHVRMNVKIISSWRIVILSCPFNSFEIDGQFGLFVPDSHVYLM